MDDEEREKDVVTGLGRRVQVEVLVPFWQRTKGTGSLAHHRPVGLMVQLFNYLRGLRTTASTMIGRRLSNQNTWHTDALKESHSRFIRLQHSSLLCSSLLCSALLFSSLLFTHISRFINILRRHHHHRSGQANPTKANAQRESRPWSLSVVNS